MPAGFRRVVAIVDDEQRFAAEAQITRRMRKHHRVFNVLDGQAHTAESRRRIRAGMARRASTGTATLTVPVG